MVDTAFTPPRVIEAELIYFCNGSTTMHQMMRVFAKKFPTYTRTLANPLVQSVIMERQVKKSPKNLAIMVALLFFFESRGIATELVPPYNKFKVLAQLPCLQDLNILAAKGKELKKLSIAITKRLAVEYDVDVLAEAMSENTKLDDLSDAFLMSITMK
jgi:hypothetical protein